MRGRVRRTAAGRVVPRLPGRPAPAAAGGTGAATLARFLPRVAREPPGYALRCRAALASTLMASLELARAGEATLEQDGPWAAVSVRAAQPEGGAAAEPGG